MKNTFKSAFITALVLGAIASASAQTDEQVMEITKNSNIEALKQMNGRLSKESQEKHQRTLSLAKQNGWPLQINKKDGSISVLHGVFEDGTTPLYIGTENYGSSLTSRANTIQPGGSAGLSLDGKGMIIGLWEINKPLTSHLDLKGRLVNLDGTSVTPANHPTHVSGTMIGSGENGGTDADGHLLGRGMAYKATIYFNDITSDLAEMASAAKDRGLLLSNHSYGLSLDGYNQNPTSYKQKFGSYTSDARDYDDVAFAAPYYQALKAAGNDRDEDSRVHYNNKGGHDLLTDWANSKNCLVVAAVNEVPNYTQASDVVMSIFSNWGPTDDNRIKPDISNKGVHVYSTTYNSANASANNLYEYMDGTSMATPGTTGALTLVQQHYSNLNGKKFMRSATLRGLVAHCADEAGAFDGPDSAFGWGLLNVGRMAKLISDRQTNSSIIREDNLAQGAVYTKTVFATGDAPLIATLSWTDRSGTANNTVTDLTTPVLVNDLDIRVTKGDQVYYPWRLGVALDEAAKQDGDNFVDNTEKVELKFPEPGEYTITISHKGNLVGNSQDYSLTVSGLDPVLGVSQNDFAKFNVWPNPVKDRLNISMESNYSGDVSVSVYDVLGKKVLGREVSGGNAVFSDTLDVSNLNSGVYILKVTQAGQTSVRKFTKE